MLQGRNSARTKPPSVSNKEQLPAGKSAARENDYEQQQHRGHSATTLFHEAPLNQAGSLQMHPCTCVVGILTFGCHPPTRSKACSPKGPWFGLTARTHLPSPLPVLVLPLFPTFRGVIALELETFDQPEQKFFTELLFCFNCASTALLHLQPAFLHASTLQSAQNRPGLSITHSLLPLCGVKLGIYLVDVRHLWPHFVLFDRFLFGLPAREWQHHLRGVRHPDKRPERTAALVIFNWNFNRN